MGPAHGLVPPAVLGRPLQPRHQRETAVLRVGRDAAGEAVAPPPYVSIIMRHDAFPQAPSALMGSSGSVGQPALPFDDSALDTPISYGLTARARRLVAPATLPDLTVLPGNDEQSPDPFDTRPARARALRRSGRDLSQIATELQVDEDLAATWALGVVPVPLRLGHGQPPSQVPRLRDAVTTTLEQRMSGTDDDVAAAGLVVGLAEVTAHAVALPTTDPMVARAVITWLRTRVGVHAARFRVTLATGPAVARDMAAHRWADAVGVPVEQVLAAPWPNAPGPTAVRATLRVADPRVATLVAGWRDALLAGEPPERETAAAAVRSAGSGRAYAVPGVGRGSLAPTS